MIHINLLPYRDELRQRQILRYIGVATVVLSVVGVLIFCSYFYESMQLDNTNSSLQTLRDQNKKIKDKIGELSKFKEVQVKVEEKLKLVTSLQKGRFRSLETQLGLASAIPKNVWLTQVKDSSGRIQLSGVGESNRAIAKFMRGLEGKNIFSGVNLKFIKRQSVNGVPLRSFSLSMQRIEAPKVKPAAKQTVGKMKTAAGAKAS